MASAVRVFFADAYERKVIRRNPTAGWNAERHLPAIEDKQRGWRERAGFSLEQVVSLTTDARLPEDRRALYALRFLGGPRPGEAANARWRNLDRARRPLWRLTLEAAFNSPMRREKSTKTGATLHIPIHPVLQGMLKEWWDEGWARTWAARRNRTISSSRATTGSSASSAAATSSSCRTWRRSASLLSGSTSLVPPSVTSP